MTNICWKTPLAEISGQQWLFAEMGFNKTASLDAPQSHILNEFVMLHFNSEGLDLDFMHF